MKFTTTALRYWKSEHSSLDKCQDYVGEAPSLGLFAAADGAGTRVLSEVWAKCLVEQFLKDPLTTANSFEVERWLGNARIDFEKAIGDVSSLPNVVRNDLRYTGSAATFVGVQFRPLAARRQKSDVMTTQTESIECYVVAMGDACAFLCRDERVVISHPKQTAADFRESPVCFPSIGYGARWWKSCDETTFVVRENDVIVLATDAVAEWLLVASDDLRTERLRLVLSLSQTPDRWPGFIDVLREADMIRDDDSTALVIHAAKIDESLPDAQQLEKALRKEREHRLKVAFKSEDWGRLALEFGSGEGWLNDVMTYPPHYLRDYPKLRLGQRIVEARRQMLEVLGRYMNFDKRNRAEVQELYERFADVLPTDPFAQGICRTLDREGFKLRTAEVPAEVFETTNELHVLPDDNTVPRVPSSELDAEEIPDNNAAPIGHTAQSDGPALESNVGDEGTGPDASQCAAESVNLDMPAGAEPDGIAESNAIPLGNAAEEPEVG